MPPYEAVGETPVTGKDKKERVSPATFRFPEALSKATPSLRTAAFSEHLFAHFNTSLPRLSTARTGRGAKSAFRPKPPRIHPVPLVKFQPVPRAASLRREHKSVGAKRTLLRRCGTHEGIRTSDLPLRRRSLYPAELRGQVLCYCNGKPGHCQVVGARRLGLPSPQSGEARTVRGSSSPQKAGEPFGGPIKRPGLFRPGRFALQRAAAFSFERLRLSKDYCS